MALSRRALSDYDSSLSQVEKAAADYVRRRVDAYLASYPGASVADVREFAVEVVNDAVGAYGDAASTAAADLYDELAEASPETLPAATVDTSDVSGYVDKEVRYQAGKLVGGAPTEFARQVALCASDQVSRRANATMRLNASRDGIRWARVPMGGETCTFCAMLASRGFAYRSARTAGKGDHWHRNCRCKVVPETAGAVEGYDPGEWAAIWHDFACIDSSGANEANKAALKQARLRGPEAYDAALAGSERVTFDVRKLTQYSLNPERQPDKARAWRGYLGYTADDAAEVMSRVYEHIANHDPVLRNEDRHGKHFSSELVMDGKDGKHAKVAIGWVLNPGTSKLRLVTIYVDE